MMNFWAQATPSAWLELYKEISSYGLPGVLFLLLVGSYYRIWRWGKDYVEREAQMQKQIDKLEELNADLRLIAARGFDVVEVQSLAIRKEAVADRARLEELNKHLREGR